MRMFVDETNFAEIHNIYCSKCRADKATTFVCANEKRCKQLNMRNIIALNTWIRANKNYVKHKLKEQGKELVEV